MKETEERDRFLVDEMRGHLSVIADLVSLGKERVASQTLLRYALEHAAELLAEAAEKVSRGTRSVNPTLPWDRFRALRRNIAHPYDVGAAPERFEQLWSFARDAAPRIARHLRSAKFSKSVDPRRE